jgi:hypothetical protein
MSFLTNGQPNIAANRITPYTDKVYEVDLPRNPERASMMSLEWIHRLIRQGVTDPVVAQTADQIMQQAGVRPGDKTRAIHAIHHWVQAHVIYEFDPDNVEMLTQPSVMIEQIRRDGRTSEDCDGMIILESSLLGALGIKTQSIILKADKRDPRQWSHILMQAHDGRGWIALDPIMNGAGGRQKQPVGWHPPKFYDRRVVNQLSGPAFPGPMPRGMSVTPGPSRGYGFLPATAMAGYMLNEFSHRLFGACCDSCAHGAPCEGL